MPGSRSSPASPPGPVCTGIGGNAHDLHPIRRRGTDDNYSANRIAAIEKAAHELLIDDGDARRGRIVTRRVSAAKYDRQFHRREEVRRQPVGVDDRRPTRRRWLSRKGDALVLPNAAQQRDARMSST